MITLYRDDEIENSVEKKTGIAVIARYGDTFQIMPAINAMLHQVGLGDYCNLQMEKLEDDVKITIKINREVE